MQGKNKLSARFVFMHSRLIGLPLVLFMGALVLDIVYSISQNPTLAGVASFLVALGIPIGILDFAFGLLNRRALSPGTQARRTAWLYETLNLVLVLLFTFSWVSRSISAGFVSIPFNVTLTFLLTLSFAGILLGLLTLWMGGEMVYGPQEGETVMSSSYAPSGLLAGDPRKTTPLARAGHYSH